MCNFSKRSIAQTEAKKRSSRDIAGNIHFLDDTKFSKLQTNDNHFQHFSMK